jgi:hypothetical protein
MVATHLLYLLTIQLFSFNLTLMIFWCLYHLAQEVVKVSHEVRTCDNLMATLIKRMSGWKMLANIKVVVLIAYTDVLQRHGLDESQRIYLSSTFSCLVLTSWVGLFELLRIYKPFRDLLQQVIAGLAKIKLFLAVFLLIIFSSTMAFDAKMRLEGAVDLSESLFMDWRLNNQVFFRLLVKQVRIALGDWDTDGLADYDYWGFFLSLITVLTTSVLMMNLMIGILCASVIEVYATSEKVSYYQLCEIVLSFEILLFWRHCKSYPPQYIVYS